MCTFVDILYTAYCTQYLEICSNSFDPENSVTPAIAGLAQANNI